MQAIYGAGERRGADAEEQFLQEMAEKHLQEEALREEQQKLGLNSSPDKIDMALDASLS